VSGDVSRTFLHRKIREGRDLGRVERHFGAASTKEE
jgi:hypothetical protein